MTNWIETYRGSVPPWHCDITEHFTIAYYFDRLEEAQAELAERLDIMDLLAGGGFVRRLNLRFARELRVGACFHVESAPLAIEPDGVLRLGHRFLDSVTNEPVTWIEEYWDLPAGTLSAGQQAAIGANLAAWDGPAFEPRQEPVRTDAFIPTARGRLKPGDVDSAGNCTLSAMVHRFSTSNGHIGAALGFDTATMQRNRRGFSTFELTLRIAGSLPVDTPYRVESGVGYLGGSSMRVIHRLLDGRTGTAVATMGQFGVNLDLDARRPARWPDEFRERATRLLAPAD